MSTVGDVGYVDEDGYLYLTDRATFMIISGGVNIYPQECENLLITHPKVADAAVFGVPNEDLGEEVKAAVQLMPGIAPGPEITAGADGILRRASGAAKMSALDRFRGRAAAFADRQALQAPAARPLLAGPQDANSLRGGLKREPLFRLGARISAARTFSISRAHWSARAAITSRSRCAASG